MASSETDLNVKEVVSVLNTWLTDTMKTQLTTSEKRKMVGLIKKIYFWVKENAPQISADEAHMQELINRLVAIDYKPGAPVSGGAGGDDEEPSGEIEETGDDLLDAVKQLEKLLLDTGLDRAIYTDKKLQKATKRVEDQVEDMEKQKKELTASIKDSKDMDLSDVDASELKPLQEKQKKQLKDLEKDKKNVESSSAKNKEKESKIKKLKTELKNLIKGNEVGNQKLAEEEVLRRKLHNEVQDLRGNIRVYSRTRRYLSKESNKPFDIPHIDFLDEQRLVLKKEQSGMRRAFSKAPGDDFVKESFKFDRVFGPRVDQAEIFTEVEPLVQSVLDGFNVCIFAYGQTGAGKTFTMNGGKGKDRGVIPRSIEFIFEKINDYRAQGWKYTTKVAIIEIYNDAVRDLLQKFKEGDVFEIKEVEEEGGGEDGGIVHDVIVTNLRVPEVKNAKEVYKLLDESAARRVTTATECNSESSRSHSVFQLKIWATDPKKRKFYSTLNLIDLAGSERLEQSGVSGQQKQEAISINKSLTTLGDVIQALGKGAKHIPYRDCALTYLLRLALGGNSKTLMFLNINPNPEFYNNSISSLRFGAKVNATHIGTAKQAAA